MLKTKNITEKNPYPKSVPNPSVHLEYNSFKINNLNEAEKKALNQIEESKKRNELKKSKNKEFKKKCNEMVLSYQDEQKKKNEEEELMKKAERMERIQKLQNFNKTLQEKNVKRKLINNNKNLIWAKTENTKNKSKSKNKVNKEYNNNKQIVIINHTNTNDDVVNLKKSESNFIAKKTILKSSSINDNENNEDEIKNEFENQNIIIDNNTNDNDNFIPKKILLNSNNIIPDNIEIENSKESEKIENENIIDLRSNLEYMINSKYFNKTNMGTNNKENDDIKYQINERMDNLKRFRSEGILPDKIEEVQKKQKKKIFRNKKFVSEFEKKRFIKALKNIFTERLGEHNIYIQNICSCGNLQKQLTAIVEKGNLTVYALTEVECANNCVFYKNKKEYMKCINDVLNSIKNIKYENFHNKYKDKENH